MSRKICPRCGKPKQYWHDDTCSDCWYADMLHVTVNVPAEDQDWEWSICEECGSSLGSDGLCHNTWCGASPFQGEDWE